MTGRLENKVAIVTGGASGIGRAICQRFGREGARVVVADRNIAGAEETLSLMEATPETAATVDVNISDAFQVERMVNEAVTRFGRLDILVNGAAILIRTPPLVEVDEVLWDLTMETNLKGVFLSCKYAIPAMTANGGGSIVNISSMTGLVANPPNGYYSSTKFALEALTEALAQEVKPFGIKVTAIEPGAFRTDWAARSMWESATPISEYADTVGSRKTMIKEFANHLPGDPRKAAEAVLMVTGLDDPPLRLLLGRDVLKAVRDKLAAFSASIDEWAPVTKDVEFPRS